MLDKFKISSKSLNIILANKSHVHRKEGIGCVSRNTQQKSTLFVKGSTLHVTPKVKCNFCSRHGHFIYKCLLKKYGLHKLVCVSKGTMNVLMLKIKINRSNHERPKAKWVPRTNPPFL